MVAFRLELARRRVLGEGFEEAWPRALRTIPYDRTGCPLRDAFAQTREAWARAYEGEPPMPGGRACLTLVCSWSARGPGSAPTWR